MLAPYFLRSERALDLPVGMCYKKRSGSNFKERSLSENMENMIDGPVQRALRIFCDSGKCPGWARKSIVKNLEIFQDADFTNGQTLSPEEARRVFIEGLRGALYEFQSLIAIEEARDRATEDATKARETPSSTTG